MKAHIVETEGREKVDPKTWTSLYVDNVPVATTCDDKRRNILRKIADKLNEPTPP